MSVASEPRTPRAFDPSDPSIVEEPIAAAEPEASAAEAAAPMAEAGGLTRPTLADLGQRGLRWGALLLSALAGAAALGAAAWFARLVSAALVREDWIGWTALVLLLVAAFAARIEGAAGVTSTSTGSRTSSIARSRARSACPPA